MPDSVPTPGSGPKRKRFAGERLGAWVFAASFSIGIWGLALKIMSPSHRDPPPISAPRYAVLAPSTAGDGTATILWAEEAANLPLVYPVTDAASVVALGASNDPNQDRD